MRITISDRLKKAQNTTAMLTTFNEIDMSTFMNIRKEIGESFAKKHGIKLGFMSAFVKATAAALKEQPVVNAVIDGNEMVYRDFIDISVAVATPTGLLVPVIRNCQGMGYADVEKVRNLMHNIFLGIAKTEQQGQRWTNCPRRYGWWYFHHHQWWSLRLNDGNSNYQPSLECHSRYACYQEQTSLRWR